MSCILALSACGPDYSTVAGPRRPPADAGASGASGSDARVPTAKRWRAGELGPWSVHRRGPRLGFGRNPADEIIAFDPLSGVAVGRYAFSPQVLDLAWDERTRRLLVMVAERFDVEGSRVHAFSFESGNFVLEASSDIMAGDARLVVLADRLIAVAGEDSAEWWTLSDDLVPTAYAAEPWPDQLHLLSPSRLISLHRESNADVLDHLDGLGPLSSMGSLSIARPANERALGVAAEGDTLWLLRRNAQHGYEIAELSAAGISSAAVNFRDVVGAACGTPHQVFVAPRQRGLFTVTSDALGAQLVRVPIDSAQSTRCTPLGAELARAGSWLPRNLVIDDSLGRAWVSTTVGVEAFTLEAPPRPLTSFDGDDLRPPLAFAP